MKKFFWCLFLGSMNHAKNSGLTDLVYKCIDIIDNCPNASVYISQYYIKINTSSSRIELWNENKFYAWLHRGHVNGRYFSNISPSKEAIYDFKECLKRHGYDIYVKNIVPSEMVDINDVKC
jgi:hypothetical protein